jgi:hypothetical protein
MEIRGGPLMNSKKIPARKPNNSDTAAVLSRVADPDMRLLELLE